jgi:hypothetical protein
LRLELKNQIAPTTMATQVMKACSREQKLFESRKSKYRIPLRKAKGLSIQHDT